MFFSCASVFNGEKTSVTIYTEKPANVIFWMDTLHTDLVNGFNAVKFDVPRSKDSLRFILQSDSLSKRVSIPSKLSLAYYLNFYPGFWSGLLVDLQNPKRYDYKNILNFDDSLNLIVNKKLTTAQREDMVYRKSKLQNKIEYNRNGSLYMNFSFPMVYLALNTIKPEGQSRLTKGGIFGLSAGFEYYYKKDRFVNLTGVLSTTNLSTCLGDLYLSDGEIVTDEDFSLYNLNISHNHRLKKHSFGYGLSYSVIYWHKDIYSRSDYMSDFVRDEGHHSVDFSYVQDCRHWRYSTLGLVFNSYYYFSEKIALGIIYKPTFVRLKSNNGNPFCYEHQIAFDFTFKFNLLRKKR